MKTKLNILFVEDVPSDFELIKYEIKKSGIEFIGRLVETKEDYTDALVSFKPDIILSDYSLPHFNGMQALEIRQKQAPHTPFILVTGALNEETAVEVMKAGSDDYIIKQHLIRIGSAIRSAIEKWDIIKSKKQTEEALIKSENILNRTSKMAKVGGWEFDLQTMTPFMTRETCRIIEVDPHMKEPIETVLKFYAPSAQPIIRNAIEATIENGTPYDLELPFITAKGKHIWVRSMGHAEMKDGKTFKLMGSIQDITERKQTEIALKESEDRFKMLFEKAPVGYQSLDENGHIIEVNETWTELLGYSKDAVKGNWFGDFLTPESTENLGVQFPLFKSQGRIHSEFEMIKEDGSVILIEFEGRIGRTLSNDFKQTHCVLHDITERRKAENKIRELSQAVEQSPASIVITNLEGEIEYTNPKFTKVTGYSNQEVLGKNPRVLKSDETSTEEYTKLWETITSGNEWKGIFHNKKKNGELYWETASISPIKNHEGITTHFLAVKEDITEKRKAEEALMESEQKFKDLANLLPQVIYEMDLNGNLTYVNNQGFELFEYSKEELEKGIHFLQIIAPEDRERAKDTIQTIVSDKEDYGNPEYNGLKKGGSVFPMLSYANVILKEKIPIGMRGVVVDITDRKLTEEALKRSEQQYRQFFEKDISGIYLSTPLGKMLDCNPAFANMLGYSIDEMLEIDTTLLYPHPVNRDAFLDKLTAKKNLIGSEIDLVHKDGHIIHCIENVVGIFNEEGQLEQFQGYLVDITERKKAEEGLRESEQNYRSVFEGVNDGIAHLDSDLNVINVNLAFEEITDISREQVIGSSGFKLAKMFVDFKELPKVLNILKNLVLHKVIPPFELNYGDKILEINTRIQEEGTYVVIVRDITERHKAKIALMESEQKYRDLADLSPQIIFESDLDGTLTYVNNRGFKIFGYSEDEFNKGVNIFQIIAPEDRERLLDNKQRTLSKETATNPEYTALKKDGTPVPILIFASAILKNGIPIGLRGVAVDITDLKAAQEAQRKTEQKYQFLANNTQDTLWTTDLKFNIKYINDALYNYLGYKPEEVIGKNKAEWTTSEGIKIIKREAKQMLTEFRNGKNIQRKFELQQIKKDGTVIDTEITGNLLVDNEGNLEGFQGRSIDITTRKQAERAIRESEEKYHGMIMNLMEGFYSATMDGKLIEYNSEFINIFGLDTNNEYYGLELPIFWEHPEVRKDYIKQFLEKGFVKDFTIDIVRKDGTPATIQINSRLIKDEFGNPLRTEGTFLDITDRIHAEKRLKQSEDQLRKLTIYMDTKTENEKKEIAKIIHDGLGQLLTGIKMDLQWIEKKWPEHSATLKDKFLSMNNIINSGVEEVQKLSGQLRPKMLDELGLLETLKSEIEYFEERTGIKCNILFQPDEFEVDYQISSTIYRVFMELLTNIYRHANATILDIKLVKMKKDYIFTVADNGVGITKDQIKDSSSFGIISIYERLKVLNGSMEIIGENNIGTTVKISIPLKK